MAEKKEPLLAQQRAGRLDSERALPKAALMGLKMAV